MKKLFALFLMLLAILPLTSCGNDGNDNEPKDNSFAEELKGTWEHTFRTYGYDGNPVYMTRTLFFDGVGKGTGPLPASKFTYTISREEDIHYHTIHLIYLYSDGSIYYKENVQGCIIANNTLKFKDDLYIRR